MGVEFRWQVESKEEWQAPASPPERRRRFPWRVVGVLALLLAVGAGITAGRFWQRARQGEARLRRELETAANLEAQALRDGDRETFLSLQDRDDTMWYARQEKRVPSWHGFADLEPGQEVNLTVLEAALMPGNRAWAEVAWALEHGVYRRVQFYRQTEEGRWLRTGARREYYGEERTHETVHFAFKYLAHDEPTVGWMAEQLEAWYGAVCTDFGCDDGQRINVLITPEDKTGKEFRPPYGFTLSSPRLRGAREDGAPMPEEREELARILIYLLAARQADDLNAWRQPYLLPQFVNWEMQRLGLIDENAPPTPVLDRVMAAHGIEGVRALLEAMEQTTSEDEALRLALGVGLEDLDVVFGQYLAALLALERQVMEWQMSGLLGSTTVLLARQTFNALLAPRSYQWHSEKETAFRLWHDQPGTYHPAMPLSRPVVERWELFDDSMLWAEVLYSETVRYPLPKGTLRVTEFFRRVDDTWRHAPPYARFLGEELTLNSEHFRVVCHEREVKLMASELVRLESLYRQIADALQTELPPGERLTIRITTSLTSTRADLEAVDAQMLSPYLSAWRDGLDRSHLASVVVDPLFDRLASRSTEFARPTGPRTMWWELVWSIWQLEIFYSELGDLKLWPLEVKPLASAVRSDELIPLSELEVTFGSEPLPDGWFPSDWTEDKAELFYIEAATIVGYAGEAYGSQVFPVLLKLLPEADSIEAWLQMALDVDPETFEADWRAWLGEQVAR